MDFRTAFALQQRFCEEYWEKAGIDPRTQEGRAKILQENSLGINTEIRELLDAAGGWKPHRGRFAGPEAINAHVTEEAVDIVKYVFGVLIALDITPEQFGAMFQEKSNVVILRMRQEEQLKRLAAENVPCAAIDLDGVLCEYPGPFEEWAIRRIQKDDSCPYYTVPTGSRLRDVLKPSRYEDLKRAWRVSGMKRSVPAVKGALDAYRRIWDHFKGEVVILSARPAWEIPGIFSDTMAWLDSNAVPYRAILFSDNKAVTAARLLPSLQLLVDDDREHCRLAALEGVPTVAWISDIARDGDVKEPPGCSRWRDLRHLSNGLLAGHLNVAPKMRGER